MSGCDEQNTECPLCMEPLEMDDINFFPCTCGYQICRFCWHRIRTDENGLCPACRKQYPEDPADFKPLTQEELQRIKNEKRQKDLQRKQKISENRKHLANVRVVQKNLVFVVGLSQRLADPEVLKRHEYFGKFGKIHKVVINHSTSYAGSQGPSASAYVTYYRVEDALRAIQAVNNIHVDGRTLKASLGTTKYCSHFLKGQQCPKPDCMYLHELGDDAASFTKEEMQQGKHQEYEKKLHEQLFNSTRKQATSPTINNQPVMSNSSITNNSNTGGNGGSKDTWPSLHIGNHNNGGSCRGNKAQNKEVGHSQHRNNHRNRNVSGEEHKRSKDKGPSEHISNVTNSRSQLLTQRSTSPSNMPLDTTNQKRTNSGVRTHSPLPTSSIGNSQGIVVAPASALVPATTSRGATPPTSSTPSSMCSLSSIPSVGLPSSQTSSSTGSPAQSLANLDSSSSSSASSSLSSSAADIMAPYYACRNGFSNSSGNSTQQINSASLEWVNNSPTDTGPAMAGDPLSIQSNTDWQAAFGFSSTHCKDDDLGFDPWDESSKALADLMEKETCGELIHTPSHNCNNMPLPFNHVDHGHPLHKPQPQVHPCTHLQLPPRRLGAPPGFSPNHMSNSYHLSRPQQSVTHHIQHQQSVINAPHHHYGESYMANLPKSHIKDIQGNHSKPNHDVYSMREWQDNLRALFPNINITFGTPNCTSQPSSMPQKGWNATHTTSTEVPWVVQDPAVVSAGSITDGRSDSPPHWMKSLQQLTEIDHPMTYNNHHRLPVVNQFSYRHPQWSTPAQIPPPGFGNPVRSSVKPTEPQKIMDNF